MAVAARVGPEHNKQEDNILQQAIHRSKPVSKQRRQTKVHKVADRAQSRGTQVPFNNRRDQENALSVDPPRMEHHKTQAD